MIGTFDSEMDPFWAETELDEYGNKTDPFYELDDKFRLQEQEGDEPIFEFEEEGEPIGTELPEEEWLSEIVPDRSSSKPRVLTYSQKDVIDKRISVPAQHALVRLSKNPAKSADAVGLLEEVKTGRLAGIYCVNWEAAAKRAERLAKTWWTVIPPGDDVVLMPDPDQPTTGAPLIAFRRELDTQPAKGCGRLPRDRGTKTFPGRLDAALAKAWQQYLNWRHRNGKAPSGTGYVPVGRCGGLTAGRAARVFSARLGHRASTQLQRRGGAPGPKPDFKNPKLCLYGTGDYAQALFEDQARRLAVIHRALDAQGDIGAVPFRTGKDIVAAFNDIAQYLKDRNYPKLKQVHIFSHGFEEGLFAVGNYTGLYRANHVKYRARSKCNPGKCMCSERQCKTKTPCAGECRCEPGEFRLNVPLPNRSVIIPRDQGARHLGDLHPGLFDDYVIFVLHACNTANTHPCWLIGPENFASALYQRLKTNLRSPQVYGNTTSDTSGCPRPNVVRRYPTVPGTERHRGIITSNPPIPRDVYPNDQNIFCSAPPPKKEQALELDLDELALVDAFPTHSYVSPLLLKPGQPVGRVLTYSEKDVIDKRISVPAQHSLVRLSKNPATSAAAVGMLEAVKAGGLGGIYCVNWPKSAKRAVRLGQAWWTVIPQGEDGAVMVDPDDLWGGQPLIVFRRELDPDCGLLEGETRFSSSFPRLDAALLRAWQTYLKFRLRPIDCFPVHLRGNYNRLVDVNRSSPVETKNLVCGPESWYRVLNEPIPASADEERILVPFKDWPVYGKKRLTFDEVRQGNLNNCPLPAILAAMVHTRRFQTSMISEVKSCVLSSRRLRNLRKPDPQNPDQSQWGNCRNPRGLLLFDECRTNRYFSVSFRTRQNTPVDVSDLFYSQAPPSRAELWYAHSTRNNLWISIVEKAYAAYRGGKNPLNGYGGNYDGIQVRIGLLTHLPHGPIVAQFMIDFCGLDYLLDVDKSNVFRNNQKGKLIHQNVKFDATLRRVLNNSRSIPTIAGWGFHAETVLEISANRIKLYDAAQGRIKTFTFPEFQRDYQYVWSAPLQP